MLKVIIADDEKMICLLISQLLDWNSLYHLFFFGKK